MRIHRDPTTQTYFINRVIAYGALIRVKRVYFATREEAERFMA